MKFKKIKSVLMILLLACVFIGCETKTNNLEETPLNNNPILDPLDDTKNVIDDEENEVVEEEKGEPILTLIESNISTEEIFYNNLGTYNLTSYEELQGLNLTKTPTKYDGNYFLTHNLLLYNIQTSSKSLLYKFSSLEIDQYGVLYLNIDVEGPKVILPDGSSWYLSLEYVKPEITITEIKTNETYKEIEEPVVEEPKIIEYPLLMECSFPKGIHWNLKYGIYNITSYQELMAMNPISIPETYNEEYFQHKNILYYCGSVPSSSMRCYFKSLVLDENGILNLNINVFASQIMILNLANWGTILEYDKPEIPITEVKMNISHYELKQIINLKTYNQSNLNKIVQDYHNEIGQVTLKISYEAFSNSNYETIEEYMKAKIVEYGLEDIADISYCGGVECTLLLKDITIDNLQNLYNISQKSEVEYINLFIARLI